MNRLLSLILLLSVFGIAWHSMEGQDSGEKDLALSEIPTVQSESPGLSEECLSLRNQSSQFMEQKNYAAAANILNKSLFVCPDRQGMLLVLAKAEMLSKQFDSSLSTLQLLLVQNPSNTDALITQGEVFYLQGNQSSAVESLKDAIQLTPTSVESHYVLGRIYYAGSNVGKATEQFQEVLKLDPNSYKAYDGLALCYETSDDIALAADIYMKGIALVYRAYPHYDVIYADFAELMLRYGVTRKAFDLAVEASDRNPGEPRNLLLAGRALYEAGQLQESVKWLERASEINPSYADPHYFLARVYRKLGRMDEAKQESAAFERLKEKPLFAEKR
jgi:tetratricopeptide (TPR) repeat protein